MAITITFYVNKSLPSVVSKTLTSAVAVSGELLEPLDEERPRIKIKANSSIESCNYFVIGNNKYFMGPIEKKNDNVWYIPGELDKLSTYETFVRNLTGYVTRGGTANANIIDSADTLLAYKNQVVLPFDNAFSEDSSKGTFVLVTAQNNYHKHTS